MITVEIPVMPEVMNYLQYLECNNVIPDIYFDVYSGYNHISTVKIIFRQYNPNIVNRNKSVYNSLYDKDLLLYVKLNGPKVKMVQYKSLYETRKYSIIGMKNQVSIMYPVYTDDIDFTIIDEFDYYGKEVKIKNPNYIYRNYNNIFKFLRIYKEDIINITLSKDYYSFINNLNKMLSRLSVNKFNLRSNNLCKNALVFN